MRRRARTDGDKIRRRDLLLESARGLFPLHGYEGTTIDMITSTAGLSPAAFYIYYRNKLDIYRSLTALGVEILQGYIEEAASGEALDHAGALSAVAGAYLRFYREHPDYYAILSVLHLGRREFFSDLDMVPLLESRTLGLLAVVEGIIGAGIAAGVFREVDARRTAVAFWGMLDGICILDIKGSTGFVGASLEELFAQTLELGFRGLFLSPPRHPDC